MEPFGKMESCSKVLGGGVGMAGDAVAAFARNWV